MRNWEVIRGEPTTHVVVFHNTENDLRLSIKWDGCTEVYGDAGGAHYCNLCELAEELTYLYDIGAMYFCDDGKKPEYAICGIDESEIDAAITTAQERINAVELHQTP